MGGTPTLVEEQYPFSGGTVDESGPYPVVKGALICGLTSEHGRDYPAEAWTPGVLAMYEGAPSYVAHASGTRDPKDKIGWWQNVRKREDGRPEGDYCLNPEHPLTKSVLWAARNKPDFYAISHRAHVNFTPRNGRPVAESWDKVHSVDLVSKGGTTGGIFESAPEGKPVPTVKEYLDKAAPKLGLKGTRRALALVEEEGFGDLPMSGTAPAPDAADTTGDQSIDAATEAVATAHLKQWLAGKMTLAELTAKLKLIDKLNGDDSAPAEKKDSGGGGDDKKKPAEESAKPPAKVDYRALVEECAAEGFKAEKSDYDVMEGVTDKATRIAHIRRMKGLTAATRPKSGHRTDPVEESGTEGGDKAKPGDWLLAGIPGHKK